ncbi:MAG: hypothetical protein K2H15_05035, partial [Muribaculaceae bacterium]|nr:hypothetical protein [Muribaculaceae bacterium]
FSGSKDIRFFKQDYNVVKNKVTEGDRSYMRFNVAPGRYDPTRLMTNLEEVNTLESIKGAVANSLTIYLDYHYDNQDFFRSLLQLETTERPGDLYIDLYDRETRQVVTIHSRRKFSITKKLINLLEEWGVRYKIGAR